MDENRDYSRLAASYVRAAALKKDGTGPLSGAPPQKAAVRMAKQYVVVSVPSKPGNNPEHIHLLTKPVLTQLFTAAGCTRLHFDGGNGRLILVAAV